MNIEKLVSAPFKLTILRFPSVIQILTEEIVCLFIGEYEILLGSNVNE